jgi:F0F1-type ATP synthase assembly protein I
VESYLVNALLAATIYIAIYFFRNRLKNNIGFLFMAGSFIKFILFFILFYPTYSADGTLDKVEFSAFFVPYAISLIVETVFMAKMLKKMDY